MVLRSCLRGIAVGTLLLIPTFSLAEIVITDPYARVSRPGAPSGAAFMVIQNTGDTADRLIEARSGVAQRVELHTHIDQGDGVMKMVEVEDGFEIEPGTEYALRRGGAHVMFMGLTDTLEQGDEVSVTLVFEQAGEITVSIPVDNDRQPAHTHGHKHGDHSGHGGTD
ncbi:MAG: copper chaperone PCu(A)C [Pseudomonadota bacterium]